MDDLPWLIRKSNKEHFDRIIGLECCGECPILIFRPFDKPSVSIRCHKCDKEKKMFIDKRIEFSCEDVTLNECIEILKKKWNEDDK